MTRLERFSTGAINAANGGALTTDTKVKRVQGAGRESSKHVRRFVNLSKTALDLRNSVSRVNTFFFYIK